jgi:hypothetical protein
VFDPLGQEGRTGLAIVNSGPAAGSSGAVPITAAAFLTGETVERIDGGAGIGMGIEATATLCTNASPLAQQQDAAEQVGPISMR